MASLGDFALETTIHTKFTTRSFSTGAPTQLAGTPNIEIYEDNSTTQITGAETLTVDFDSITGLNHLAIAATAANGFEAGKFYQAVIQAGTVGGVSVVGEVVCEFTIEATAALRPATNGREIVLDANGGVDLRTIAGSTVSTSSAQLGVNVVNAGGTAWASGSLTSGVFASGAITATAIAADAIGASELAADAVAEIADAIWDEDATGHQTQGTFGQAIGDPGADTNTIFKAVVTDATGATVGVDVAAVLADTGTDGVVVASINTGAITATAIAADAIGASELAADAATEIATAVWATATRTLSALDEDATTLDLDATIRAAVGLAAADLDTQLAALPTAAENADAVWEEALADHSGTVGSTAESLAAAGSAGDPWATQLPGVYGAGSAGKIVGDNINAPIATVDTVVDAIKAKTDSLTFTVAGQVDANIESVNAVTVNGTGTAGDPWGP